MQAPSRDFKHTVASQQTDEVSPSHSHQPSSSRDSAGRTPRQILPWPQGSLNASSPLRLSNDLSHRRYRTNVTVACDLCKVKRAKCNGKNPCSRCSSKSLTCSYDQGSDGRRGRSSPTEVQALADKVQQYQRLFDILRTSPPNAACNILHHLRSQQDETMDGSDPATETNLAKVLRYAETLASRSPSPDANNIPSPLTRAWRETASVPSESTSQEAASENGSSQRQPPPATLASPGAWSGNNNVFDPQFATISNDFTLFGFNGSTVQTESSLPSDNEHYHTNTSDGVASNVAANMPPAAVAAPAAAATSHGNNPPATWHPHTSTDFDQAHAWLRQDMDQIDRYLDSNLGRKKSDYASRRLVGQ